MAGINKENTGGDSNIQRTGWEVFRRELPRLLQDDDSNHKWVAFHGDKQVALGDEKLDVYKQLEESKVPLTEVVVRKVEPLEPQVDLRRPRRAPRG